MEENRLDPREERGRKRESVQVFERILVEMLKNSCCVGEECWHDRKKLLYKFCSALSVSTHCNHHTHPELSEVKILIAFNIFRHCFLWILHYAKTGPQRAWLNSNYQNAKNNDIFCLDIFHRYKLVTHNFKIRKISAYSFLKICLVGLSVFTGSPSKKEKKD